MQKKFLWAIVLTMSFIGAVSPCLAIKDIDSKNAKNVLLTSQENSEDILKLLFPEGRTMIYPKTRETYIKHNGSSIEKFIGAHSEIKPWTTRILLIVPGTKPEKLFFVLTETFHENINSHVDRAVLGFSIIQFSKNKTKIVLHHQYSSLFGMFGRFLHRKNISLLALSPQRLGVLIQSKDIHQGITSHTLHLYEIRNQGLATIFSGFLEPESNAGEFNPFPMEEPLHDCIIERSLFLTTDLNQSSKECYDLLLFINGIQFQYQNFLVKNFENNVTRLKCNGNQYIPEQTLHKDFRNTTDLGNTGHKRLKDIIPSKEGTQDD